MSVASTTQSAIDARTLEARCARARLPPPSWRVPGMGHGSTSELARPSRAQRFSYSRGRSRTRSTSRYWWMARRSLWVCRRRVPMNKFRAPSIALMIAGVSSALSTQRAAAEPADELPQSTWQFTAGLGAMAMPRFPGSDRRPDLVGGAPLHLGQRPVYSHPFWRECRAKRGLWIATGRARERGRHASLFAA